MTNLQLYIAVCLPTLAVFAALAINLLQISGLRDDIREIRTMLRQKLNL